MKYGDMGKYAEVIGRHPRERLPGTAPLPLFGRDEHLGFFKGRERAGEAR